jgi:hypothetical protein
VDGSFEAFGDTGFGVNLLYLPVGVLHRGEGEESVALALLDQKRSGVFRNRMSLGGEMLGAFS